ncbi:MAG TPA: hypothetical protein VJM11_04290 [Nevskiaceae bacterium]|nr:hypothetical protein [Nevskiaceae bacterium]
MKNFLKRSAGGLAASTAAMLMLGALAVTPAYAVHDLGLLELDGNAANEGNVAGDDWVNIKDGNSNADADTGIIVENLNLTFTNGSKDTGDIGTWKSVTGNVPDKDNILNAYAAKYTATQNSGDGSVLAGDTIIYAGLDRAATNGTASAGFWFFQNAVARRNDGTFSGSHKIGDLLMVFEFTGSGGVGEAVIYRWNGSTIVPVATIANADCRTAHASGAPCGRSNLTNTTLPWPYVPKTNIGTNVAAPGAFMEFGINISKLGRDGSFVVPCFASFMSTTRTAISETASIKNFTAPRAFDACGLTVTKICAKGGGGDGFNDDFSKYVYDFSGVVTSQGGTLFDVEVVEGTPNNPGPVVASFNSVGINGTAWGPLTIESTTTISSNTVFARASASDGGPQTVIADAVTATCPPINASPSLRVTKACRTCLKRESAQLIVKVHAAGQACNDQAGAIPLKNVTVTDEAVDDKGTLDTADDEYTQIGVHNLGDLAINQCKDYSDDYAPSVLNSGETPHDAQFKDRVTATATTTLGFSVPDAEASATCSVCPGELEPGQDLECPGLDD